MNRTQHQSYQPWRIGAFPKGHSDMLSLRGGFDGFEINLVFHQAKQIVTVKFASTYVYRVIDESNRLLQLQQLPLPMEETIYVVSDSDMVDELIAETCGILSDADITHYFIVTSNDCIDILARTVVEPEIKGFEPKPLASKVTVSDEKLIVDLVDGRSLTIPLAWYPRLLLATSEERQRFELRKGGYAVIWPHLGEFLSIEKLVFGSRSEENQESIDRWLASRREINDGRI